jgi:hypothetical protein
MASQKPLKEYLNRIHLGLLSHSARAISAHAPTVKSLLNPGRKTADTQAMLKADLKRSRKAAKLRGENK